MKKKTFTQQNSSSAAGMLKIFFSYASGSGSTGEMLEEIKELEQQGATTIISLRRHPATGEPFGEEFNLQEALSRKPQYVAIDNLAVENPDGHRHKYRFKDVEELLAQGINVYATMQVGDLEGEADRFTHITGVEPILTVPDRFFYDCNQLEFVDIDPKELVERSKKRGVEQYSHAVLSELRALALHCVSEYAAHSAHEEGDKTLSHVLEEKVLGLVFLDGRAGDLVHEAARLAEALKAPFEVLYVESLPDGSRAREKSQEVLARIGELVESLNGTLVVLNGEDTIGVAADYIHTHGITDVVLARKMLSWKHRLVLPVRLPLDEKIAFRAPYVHIHTIPLFDLSKKFRVYAPRFKKSVFQLSVRDFIFSVAVVAAASVLIGLLSNVGFSSQTSLLIYILAAAIVARFTKGYTAGILASIGATLAMSYFFIRPYFSFEVDHKGNYVTFVIMLVVSLIITTLATRMQRDSVRARYREQHTQVLYDLNRTLLFSRGIFDVVSTSLDTLTRLFDKSAIFYTDDPYIAGSSRSRGALLDTNVEIFKTPIEQEAAHWAYLNNQPAGAMTETFKLADSLYLPLSAGKEARGVIGISMRTGEISQDDRTFLEMVATQISLALERQHLFDEHRHDLRTAELDSIRAHFAEMVVGYAESSAQLIASSTRQMLGLHGKDTADQRDDLLAFITQEGHRQKRFTESLNVVLSKRSDKIGAVDIHYLIQQAIKRVREDYPAVKFDFDNRSPKADLLLERATIVLALKNLLAYAAQNTPDKSSLEIGIKVHAKQVIITIADERKDQDSQVLDKVLASRYIHEREKTLREMLETGSFSQVNTQKEDLEIALVLAVAGIKAHGGKVKSRRRLGGGMVTSVWLPR